MVAHITKEEPRREETVSEHTKRTEYLCREKGKRRQIAEIMSLCAILHDMGKNKKKFDDYIHADESKQKKLRGKIAHASTGAKYVYDNYHGSEKQSVRILAELISYAVAAHHGLFDCVDNEHTDVFRRRTEEVEDYEEACANAVKDYLDSYHPDEIFQKALHEFETMQSKIKTSWEQVRDLLGERQKGGQKSNYSEISSSEMKRSLCKYRMFLYAGMQRLILSILIDSDWEATSDFMADIDTLSKQVSLNRKDIFTKARLNFDSYMQKKQVSIVESAFSEREKEIIDARNLLQRECREFAKHPAGIYCLPIPTGGGKTLSGLAYALEYCRQHPETERVIYVSPYISITEQNAEVFRQALGEDEWILEHHSSVIRDEEEGEDYQTDSGCRLDINWEEPFICTTFVQFMNALFSDRKQSIRRMHRLIHAVVIIDEVQSMPLKCAGTFNYMMNFLNAVCGTDIVLCTATQPTLAEADCPLCYSTPKYMIAEAEKWFEKFKRVQISFPERSYTFERLKDEIMESMQQYRSILVVLNTKSAVRKMYDLLCEEGILVEYLTTNLCAEHRSDKITQIKKILKAQKEHMVVVSTNLIEAGVDISFECVYRSMTGLDSLAQSAGRCNRNGEKNRGMVHLIELEGENTGNMEELLQNADVTRKVLAYYERYGSRENLLAPGWMNQYYKLLYIGAGAKMNFPLKDKNTNILDLLTVGYANPHKRNFMNQAFSSAGKEYRIIDDHSLGVIVPYRKGEEIIASLQETTDLGKIGRLIRNAQRYTVNVRGSQLKKMEGLLQPVTENIPNLYMIAAPGAYHEQYGITEEWEPLII